MAKAKLDIPTQIPAGATRPLYAGVGVTDLVVETVREYVADVQKRVDGVQKAVSGLEVKPEELRDRATKSVSERIDTLSKDAVARRKLVEQRVAELQSEVQALPTRLQKLVDSQVATAGDTYADLVKRGESLVGRIRRPAGHPGRRGRREDHGEQGQDHEDPGQEDHDQGPQEPRQEQRQGHRHRGEEDRDQHRQGRRRRRGEDRRLTALCH